MRLFHSPASPYVRKVMVLAHETGLAGRIALTPAGGTAIDPGTMPIDRNPLGKIPVLITETGQAIYDSRVICRYLDAMTGGGLYGGGDRLWEILTLEATADGILDAALAIVYEGRVRPAELHYQPWLDGQWKKIARAVAEIGRRWPDLLSGPPNMGQIATGCALGYLDFRLGARDWRSESPALAAWYRAFAARPAMLATAPQG